MALQPANLPVAYLNGVYLPLDEARISPLDRGFLLGDGVYEVIPCYAGKPFRLEPHLTRMQRSLNAIGIPAPHTLTEWTALLNRLVAHNGGSHQSLYLQVTRGAPDRRDHRFPAECPPTVFAYCTALDDPDTHSLEEDTGIRCITCDDIRWRRCDIKAVTLLANVLLREQARAAGCDEAILIRSGWVTEGSTSNVFVVSEGEILTPCAGPDVLGGITRDLVIELAAAHGFSLQETFLDPRLLTVADEIWISSSTRGVRPVVVLDGKPVGDGRPGPLWRRMAECYREFRRALMA